MVDIQKYTHLGKMKLMWHGFKRYLIPALIVMLFAIPLSGCKEDGPTTLRILVEESDSKDTVGFRKQVTIRINQFRAQHEDVKIILEELPLDSKSRDIMIQQIRSEIMAGKGPDIILMPNAYSDRSVLSARTPLINDVAQAMNNGIFLDISEYYDADTTLETEKLLQTVMNAGVVRDARYVLPLRYDIPVIYVDKQGFAETGLNKSILEQNVLDLMKSVVNIKNNTTASNFRMHWMQPQFTMNFFPNLFDYDTGEVALSQAELETFFNTYQEYWVRLLRSFSNGSLSYRPIFYQYLSNGEYWTDTGNFLFIGSLQQAMETVAIANTRNIELEMYPIRSTDGSVIADVTFYGAITAGCKYPNLAYEFIRDFLTEDFQWETNLSGVTGYWNLAAYGWPVRAEGSFSALAESVRGRSELQFAHSKHPITMEGLTDDDLPILTVEIDQARFSIPLERSFRNALKELYISKENAPSNIDISQLADDWIEKLQLHLDEG